MALEVLRVHLLMWLVIVETDHLVGIILMSAGLCDGRVVYLGDYLAVS